MSAPADISSPEFAVWTQLQQALRDLDSMRLLRDDWKSEALRLRGILVDSLGDGMCPPTAREEAARWQGFARSVALVSEVDGGVGRAQRAIPATTLTGGR